MSNEDLDCSDTPWLGGLYQKIGEVYDEIDNSMSHNTVNYARNHLQTVGENVRKLGSHVIFDLPLPSFLSSKSNSTSSLGKNTVIKPKINVKVTDIECPADAITEHLAAEEFMSPSSKDLSGSAAGLHCNLKDDHWSSENWEIGSKVGKFSTSESSLLSSLTIMGQELENKLKDQMPSSKEGSGLTHAYEKDAIVLSDDESAEASSVCSLTIIDQEVENETKDQMSSSSDGSGSEDVESFPQSASINKDRVDVPQSDSPRPAELFFVPNVECAPDFSTVLHCSEVTFSAASCQSDAVDHLSISSRSSSLIESLNLVEASHSGLTETEAKTCNGYYDPSSYLIDSSLSSFSDNSAGQSSSPVSALEDLLMDKIDLFDKIELDEMGVTGDRNMDLVVSSSRGSCNPYKKMFKNPFATKKRLEKDYKLLSIWYGDIDTEFSEITRTNKTLKPVVHNKEVIEDEWEIV